MNITFQSSIDYSVYPTFDALLLPINPEIPTLDPVVRGVLSIYPLLRAYCSLLLKTACSHPNDFFPILYHPLDSNICWVIFVPCPSTNLEDSALTLLEKIQAWAKERNLEKFGFMSQDPAIQTAYRKSYERLINYL